MVFSPLSLTQGANASFPFESLQSDNAYNIPIVVPFEDDHMLPSDPENVNVESLGENNELNDSLSTFSTCDKLSVSGVTAIGSDGNVPSNAIDNNLNTRWSNNGIGSWIQLDLGSKKGICSTEIAWYRGDVRQNNFIISVSDDGTTFTNKFSGSSSGSTTSFEKYTLPTGTEGRYVRITVNGNNENAWASITEIGISGSSTATITCTKLPVSSVTAIGNDGNVPINAIDNNLNTRWSNNGIGSWIQLDLGAKKSICSVDIAWYVGNTRQNTFAISVSDDGTTFTNKFTGTSSGSTISPEKYNMPAGTEGRYVRITVNGNTQNEWASITEIGVFGSERGSSPLPPSISSPGPLYHRWQNTAGTTTSWSTWTSLSGALKSSPEVAINSDGRLEVFVLGSNNALYHRWQNTAGSSTSWSSWVSLSGKLAGNPAVAMNSDGRLEVFAVAANNQLYHRWQNTAGSSNSWSQWVSLGGTLISNPAVAINSDGRLEVFAIGANNQLYHRWQNTPGSSSSWSAWTSLGGTLTGDPAVARNSDGRLEVFVIGATNNALYHKWQNSPSSSSSWSAYHSLGGSLKGDLAVTRNADGRLEVFVIGANGNALYHKWQNTAGTTTSWSAYHLLGGSISGNPVVGVNQDGRLEVFVVGANGNALYHKWQNTAGTTTSWSAYHSLGGTIAGDPGVARNSDGRLEAFVIGGGGRGGGGGDSGTNDKFGIKKIYPTKPNGEEWYMNMQNPNNDPRSSEPSMSKNPDGSWKVTSNKVRYGVFTSSGYQPGNVVKDHSVIANRGYMQSPNDWKNIEMTGQVKFVSGDKGDEWSWYSRGGRHTGSGWQNGCEGSAYKGHLDYVGGKVRYVKEQWHVSYVNQPYKNSPANSDGKFVGFKAMMYNVIVNGQPAVKLELWVDPNNNNNWQKVYDFTDKGGWGSKGGECRGKSDQVLTWGGPIAAFRWDGASNVHIKNFSVREIVPPS